MRSRIAICAALRLLPRALALAIVEMNSIALGNALKMAAIGAKAHKSLNSTHSFLPHIPLLNTAR